MSLKTHENAYNRIWFFKISRERIPPDPPAGLGLRPSFCRLYASWLVPRNIPDVQRRVAVTWVFWEAGLVCFLPRSRRGWRIWSTKNHESKNRGPVGPEACRRPAPGDKVRTHGQTLLFYRYRFLFLLLVFPLLPSFSEAHQHGISPDSSHTESCTLLFSFSSKPIKYRNCREKCKRFSKLSDDRPWSWNRR